MDNKSKNNQYLELEKLRYDDNSQNVKLIPDTPIIARKNSKEFDIFNNETFIIKNIQYEKETIIISDGDEKIIPIPFDAFQKMFYVAYAITIYKFQGSTFEYPYTIHGFNRPLFDDRLKYSSLSRATDINI